MAGTAARSARPLSLALQVQLGLRRLAWPARPAAGAGIGAAWRETLGKNFPPSTLLYIAGLVDERREANRVYYSLVEDRLALCVGQFLSTVCPDQVVLRQVRKRRGTVQTKLEGTENAHA